MATKSKEVRYVPTMVKVDNSAVVTTNNVLRKDSESTSAGTVTIKGMATHYLQFSGFRNKDNLTDTLDGLPAKPLNAVFKIKMKITSEFIRRKKQGGYGDSYISKNLIFFANRNEDPYNNGYPVFDEKYLEPIPSETTDTVVTVYVMPEFQDVYTDGDDFSVIIPISTTQNRNVTFNIYGMDVYFNYSYTPVNLNYRCYGPSCFYMFNNSWFNSGSMELEKGRKYYGLTAALMGQPISDKVSTELFIDGKLVASSTSTSAVAYTEEPLIPSKDVEAVTKGGSAIEQLASDVYQKVNGKWVKVADPMALIPPGDPYKKV